WCKLLAPSPHQLAIIRAMPGRLGNHGSAVMVLIGLAESAIAIWVLTARAPVSAAAAQTGLLFGMNTFGLFCARGQIPDAPGIVIQNIAFLALAWTVAWQHRQLRTRLMPACIRSPIIAFRTARISSAPCQTPWFRGTLAVGHHSPELLFGRMYEDCA